MVPLIVAFQLDFLQKFSAPGKQAFKFKGWSVQVQHLAFFHALCIFLDSGIESWQSLFLLVSRLASSEPLSILRPCSPV